MALEVYLNFNGNCRQAVDFYSEVFNTEITQIMTFGEAPQSPDYQLPEEAKDLVMHARLTIDGNRVMFSDTFPGFPFVEGNNVSLAFVNKDIDLIQTVFDKLKQGGTVTMDLQETFWSKSYGSLKDQYGIEWQISHEE